MTDRIGMRENMATECAWHDPLYEQPEWRIWRKKLDNLPNIDSRPSSPDSPDLCRSLRCFIGWKP
jgi:hypothetical protein